MKGHTHYLPFFTVNGPNGTQQSVCGQFVTAEQLAPEGRTPTCWGCALWLHEVAHPPQTPTERARVLAQITAETPWGVPLEAR